MNRLREPAALELCPAGGAGILGQKGGFVGDRGPLLSILHAPPIGTQPLWP
jgi:hypothetical protein